MNILLAHTTDEMIQALVISLLIVFAVWEILKKIADILNTYYRKRKGKEDIEKHIEESMKSDEETEKMISVIIDVMFVQMRHSIVRICEESLKQGEIGANELESLEELFAKYGSEPFNGNSYVHNLMKRVRKLPIDYSNGNPKDVIH